MNQSRFTLNAFLVAVICFSAIIFVVALVVPDVTDSTVTNDFYPIEGTDYAVVYSTKKPNGIYEGYRQTGELRLEGTFGHDWGIVYAEPYLYTNEYTATQLGLAHCNVVRIDLRSFEKEVLYGDAILRGQCASGELAIVTGFLMPSTFPETDSFCSLYAMTDPNIDMGGTTSHVVFVNPESASEVGAADVTDVDDDAFEEHYLARGLEEILKGVES